MARQITVITPENVRIEYELAGLASRGAAALVDTALQGLVLLLIVAAKWLLTVYGKWPGANWADAALGIVMFVAWYGYFVYFETVWSGQTPGKRIARLRAVREGGLPVDVSSAAIRNLVRTVDFLPVLYLFGAFAILFGSRNKRLGDIAAGTMVIKERGQHTATALIQIPDLAEAPVVKNIELITPDEFEAAKRFVERMPELQDSIRTQLAERIAGPIMLRLGIETNENTDHCALLRDVYDDCVRFRGMR